MVDSPYKSTFSVFWVLDEQSLRWMKKGFGEVCHVLEVLVFSFLRGREGLNRQLCPVRELGPERQVVKIFGCLLNHVHLARMIGDHGELATHRKVIKIQNVVNRHLHLFSQNNAERPITLSLCFRGVDKQSSQLGAHRHSNKLF